MNKTGIILLALAIVGIGVLLVLSTGDGKVAVDTSKNIPDYQIGGSTWPIFRGDRHLSGLAEGALPDKLKVAWKFKADGDVRSSPVVSGAKVYFGTTKGTVYCFSVDRGKEIWSHKLPEAVEASVSLLANVAFVGCEDGFVYAIDTNTSEELWKFETDDKVLGSANAYLEFAVGEKLGKSVGEMRIAVGSYDGYLYSINVITGELAWKYETDSYINGTPAISDGLVVTGGCDSMLHVVSTLDGVGVKKIDAGAYIAGSPAFVDGRVYVGNYDDEFLCVDIDKGEIVWTYEEPKAPIFSSPAVDAEVVIFGCKDKTLYCVDKLSGQEKWQFKGGGEFDSSPVICGDKVIVGCEDGRLYMIDINSGEKVWEYETGSPIISSPAVADGKVIVGCDDGYVYAFEARE